MKLLGMIMIEVPVLIALWVIGLFLGWLQLAALLTGLLLAACVVAGAALIENS